MHINTQHDYDGEWIFGSTLLFREKGRLIWLDDGCTESDLEEAKRYATWVESERLFFAITDREGNPVEMPENRIHQVWHTDGKAEEKHFDLKEFTGKWDSILRPYYER